MKIAIEEAFATPALMQGWRDILADGAPGEIGLGPLLGRLLAPTTEWDDASALPVNAK